MPLLSKPEYIHVLLNHFPLTGLGVALLALAAGLIWRNVTALRIGLGLAGLMALSAWPVIEYGEKAYDRVRTMEDEEGQQALETHARLADRWEPLYFVAGIVAWLGVGLSPRRFDPLREKCLKCFSGDAEAKRLRWLMGSAWITLILGLGCLAAGFQIAKAGGAIRHHEFREHVGH